MSTPHAVKRFTWCILVDMMSEAWELHDPIMLATAYRFATLASEAS